MNGFDDCMLGETEPAPGPVEECGRRLIRRALCPQGVRLIIPRNNHEYFYGW